MKAGIPVIELDRQTNGTPGKDYTAFVGGDNYKIAFEAGVYTAKTLLPDGGDVAVLEGLPSSTPAVQRLNGFKDGVKQNPKIKVVAEQAADWVPDKAQTAFSAMLQANPDIKVVYASNDMMAAGSYLAAKGAGKDGKIGIIGTDGLPGPAGGVRAVASDEWAATFTYPTGARRSARSRQENPARLRGIGARHRDGADAGDHQGQRRRPRQEAEVLRRSNRPWAIRSRDRLASSAASVAQIDEGAGLPTKRMMSGRPAIAPPSPSEILSGKHSLNAVSTPATKPF